VQREGPLHPHSEGVLANGEGLAGAASLALDHDPLEHLGSAPVALDHLEVDPDAVTGRETGTALERALLDAVDDRVHLLAAPMVGLRVRCSLSAAQTSKKRVPRGPREREWYSPCGASSALSRPFSALAKAPLAHLRVVA
jgi:hypothetical protein